MKKRRINYIHFQDEWARNYSLEAVIRGKQEELIAKQKDLIASLQELKVKVVEKGVERVDKRIIEDVFEDLDSVGSVDLLIKRDLNTGWRFYSTLSMWLGEVADELTKRGFSERFTDKWQEAKFLRDLALKYINDEL